MLHILIAAALLLLGETGSAQTTLLGRYNLPDMGGTIGGLSAIEVTANGSALVILSDRGFAMTGTIDRDDAGRMRGVTTTAPIALQTTASPGRQDPHDSEGIAIGSDGTIYISFESFHRVSAYPQLDGPEQLLPANPAFETLQANSSLEALAIDAQGGLYTIPERSGRYDKPFPIFRFRDGVWDTPYLIPRTGPFLVVGADFGPDGMLYLLERDFTGFGFQTRVRRVDLTAGRSETILQTNIGTYGNLEGISVWLSPTGEMIMSLIADNNFSIFLPNEIVEFRITG